MSIDRLAQLKSLHLYGMATAWAELLAEGVRRPIQPDAWLDRLILKTAVGDVQIAPIAGRLWLWHKSRESPDG